jgi:hypothetical protein
VELPGAIPTWYIGRRFTPVQGFKEVHKAFSSDTMR